MKKLIIITLLLVIGILFTNCSIGEPIYKHVEYNNARKIEYREKIIYDSPEQLRSKMEYIINSINRNSAEYDSKVIEIELVTKIVIYHK